MHLIVSQWPQNLPPKYEDCTKNAFGPSNKLLWEYEMTHVWCGQLSNKWNVSDLMVLLWTKTNTISSTLLSY